MDGDRTITIPCDLLYGDEGHLLELENRVLTRVQQNSRISPLKITLLSGGDMQEA
jgi:hypothetical protein